MFWFLLFYKTLCTFSAAELFAAISQCYRDNSGWQLDNFCYDIVFHDLNWYDARNYCARRGGDLAEIRTKRIQVHVVTYGLSYFICNYHCLKLIELAIVMVDYIIPFSLSLFVALFRHIDGLTLEKNTSSEW